MKRKNKLIYILTYVVIIIIFLVIIFFGKGIKNIVFIDDLSKQPINHIRNIKEEEKPTDNKDGDNKKNNNKNNNNNDKPAVKPNTESPIKYVFNEDKKDGNYIYLINQFPTKDEVGRKLEGEYKTFDFRLEFKDKALGASYDITLEKMENSDIENNWVKVYLESGTALKESLRSTGRVKTFDEYKKYSNKDEEIILYQGVVTASDIAKGYRDFTLRMWISEDIKVQNEEYKSKSIIARVNVYAIGN